MVVAQLVERSLPIPEVRSSNPVIGKNLYRTFTVNCIEKTKINKKRPGMAHFLKKTIKTFRERKFLRELKIKSVAIFLIGIELVTMD